VVEAVSLLHSSELLHGLQVGSVRTWAGPGVEASPRGAAVAHAYSVLSAHDLALSLTNRLSRLMPGEDHWPSQHSLSVSANFVAWKVKLFLYLEAGN
jgi:hypothetical protein